MAEDWKEHQQKLAAAGNRVPDHFYAAETDTAQSSEQKSGDGGAAVGDAKATGTPPTADPAEVAPDMDELRTVDPETGQTIPDAVREQQSGEGAKKKASGPSQNKGKK